MSKSRPARGGQLPLQVLVLSLQPLVLTLQAVDLPLLPIMLASLLPTVALSPRQFHAEPFDLGLQVLRRIAVPGFHAKVMPQFRKLYKSKFDTWPRTR